MEDWRSWSCGRSEDLSSLPPFPPQAMSTNYQGQDVYGFSDADTEDERSGAETADDSVARVICPGSSLRSSSQREFPVHSMRFGQGELIVRQSCQVHTRLGQCLWLLLLFLSIQSGRRERFESAATDASSSLPCPFVRVVTDNADRILLQLLDEAGVVVEEFCVSQMNASIPAPRAQSSVCILPWWDLVCLCPSPHVHRSIRQRVPQ